TAARSNKMRAAKAPVPKMTMSAASAVIEAPCSGWHRTLTYRIAIAKVIRPWRLRDFVGLTRCDADTAGSKRSRCLRTSWRYTAHELRYVLEDSKASHVVIHADSMHLLPHLEALQVVLVGGAGRDRVSRWDDLLRSAPGFAPAREPALDDLVNIQYTSGTTGW